jgi:quinol-cytochrome oxidoreductase complex cytochrome b subunit
LSLFLVLVLILTGVLEMFYYIPTPEEAALSIQALNYFVPYGGLVRNLHFWAAQALVVTVCVHLLRVILTGAYAQPRRFNYLLGLSLFVLTLFLDFTGYVLRWDEGVRWALVAGTHLVQSIPVVGPPLYRMVIGGSQPGAPTLLRFYAWHIFGLTAGLVALISWHVFRVRRDGGLAAPARETQEMPGEPPEDNRRITRFELARREAIASLFALAALFLIAGLLPAPVQPPMSETGTLGGDARAPWFFLWVQQLLKWGDPFFLGVLAPAGVLAFLAFIPTLLLGPAPRELGRWFPRRARLAQILTLLIALLIFSLTILSLVNPA